MRRKSIWFALFSVWWILVGLGLKTITLDAGELPVDYRTYVRAAERVGTTGSPYSGVLETQAIWGAMHRSALAVFRPGETTHDTAEVVSGPYLYPPTLALVLQQSGFTPLAYIVLMTAGTLALGLGWSRLSGMRSAFWLLGIAVSPDLLAVFMGGNIEILLVALSLVACVLVFREHFLAASLPIAAVLLVKPHFLLLFVAFVCIRAASGGGVALRKAGLTAVSVGVLMALEVLRWPAPARADFLSYAANAASYQYFSLPPDAQWPMNIWNRAPLQTLLGLGLPFEAAQVLTLALYGCLVGASAILLRGRACGFPVTFALSYTLLTIGRPITWSLPLLAVFCLTAIWPVLSRGERVVLALVACGIAASHWAAFILFAAGRCPGLLTLQVPTVPWETVLVLPGALAIVVLGARRGTVPIAAG